MTTVRRASLIATLACSLLAMTASATQSAKFTVDKSDYSIKESLTDQAGDPVKGREVAIDRKKGNCLACHTLPIPEQPFHGRIAPPLMGVGARYSPAQLRLRVVNPKMLNPNTIMPSYYKSDGFHRTMKKFAGKSILSAQEVEDIIAYLSTLK